MYVVEFENFCGKRDLIAEVTAEQDAFKAVHNYIKKRNFESYYQRLVMRDENTIMVDYGSYSQFFYITKDSNSKFAIFEPK